MNWRDIASVKISNWWLALIVAIVWFGIAVSFS